MLKPSWGGGGGGSVLDFPELTLPLVARLKEMKGNGFCMFSGMN